MSENGMQNCEVFIFTTVNQICAEIIFGVFDMAVRKENGFFEISGGDINSPRQSFICPSLELPEYSHLRTSTYALIGHEISASRDLSLSMFSPDTVNKTPDLSERINQYAVIGGIR